MSVGTNLWFESGTLLLPVVAARRSRNQGLKIDE
jgi:hypothetical protein